MIISHKLKFIFIAIPKTGTHSIREHLRPKLGRYDWEQCKLYQEKCFPQQRIKDWSHGHIPISEIDYVLTQDLLSRYFKFCFIRDPIERFLSYMFFVKKRMKCF